MRARKRTSGNRVRAAAAALLLLAALALAGCGWTGQGKQVAQAIERTEAFKTRAFTGSIDIKIEAAQDQSMHATFSGAIDDSDAANPRMAIRMNFDAAGRQDSASIVGPGDGNMYVTTPTGTYGFPISPSERQNSTIDAQRIYAAIGDAIGGFKRSAPMTNAKGAQVETIAATADRGKLCGKVLPAFGEAMSKLSAGGTNGGFSAFSGGKSLVQMCQVMLVKDPKLWFGIDNGALTDVALEATIAMPLAGAMQLDLQYHEYDQGLPQKGIVKPNGAQMLSSPQDLAQFEQPVTAATSQ